MPAAPHLAFVVNTDWFFLSHRLPVARAALGRGYRVTLVAPDCGHAGAVCGEGIGFVPLSIDRGGVNPFRDAGTLRRLYRIYRRLAPDIVHHVTPKPVLYGSLAARAAGVPAVVNAVSGLGTAFVRPEAPLARLVEGMYRVALKPPTGPVRARTIFQNPDDAGLFTGLGLVDPSQVVLVRGSGVDLERFRPSPPPEGPKTVLFASRLLREKGVDTFLEVAERIAARRSDVRFVLAGRLDPDNPGSLSTAEVEAATRRLPLSWWGHVEDMPAVFAGVHVVVFPTRYREGLPKVLAEAAACGRAVVASDVPGCREVVRHGGTGYLVPPGDVEGFVSAVDRLLTDDTLRDDMGAAGRRLAERGLGVDAVVEAHLRIYDELLSSAGAGPARRPIRSARARRRHG